MVKKVGKYEMYKTLGEGTFGKVKYSINTETQEPCAIKVLDKEQIQKLNMGNQIKKEISIMKMVRHKYIVGMKEVLASKTKIFIVLDLVTGGELFDKIVSVGRFNEQKARFYFCQLIEGVEYCHSMGVCHRDLKPENLLLDEHGNLKISDFGLSSLYVGDADGGGTKRTEVLHTTCGTPNYVAPEVLADNGYDGKKADAWSIGVILYVLLAGFLPFDEGTITLLFAKIQAAEFTYPAWFTPEVRTFLDGILVADPKIRTSVGEMRTKPWITSGVVEAPAEAVPAPVANGEPTQDLLEATVEIAMADGGHEAHAEESDDDEDVSQGQNPKTLNAFGLVNQCGGFALGRMFSPKTFMPISHEEEHSLVHRHRKAYQYSSAKKPADLYVAVVEALKALNFRVVMQEACFKLRATLLTPAKGMIGLSVQVFMVGGCTDSLCLLEVRRGKGDLMEFHNVVVKEFIDKKLVEAGGWISKASSTDGAKAESS